MPGLTRDRAKVYESAARRDSSDHKAPHILTPAQVIAPGCGDPALLTTSPARRRASHADLAAPCQRFASNDNLGCPSRIGDRLHYRNGEITDLDGQVLYTADGQRLSTRAPTDHKRLNRTSNLPT